MKNFLGLIENYTDMLNRIALFTFITNILIVVILKKNSIYFQDFVFYLYVKFPFLKISIDPIFKLPMKLIYLLPSAIITLIFRIVYMHNKISDLFKIRKNFDVKYILVPLSNAVEIPIDKDYLTVLNKRRKDLMADVFYKYASSTNPQIDKHLIWIALDKWSWYWIFIEFITSLFIWGLILFFLKDYLFFLIIFSIIILFSILSIFWIKIFPRYAKNQIDAIISNEQFLKEIKGKLYAL